MLFVDNRDVTDAHLNLALEEYVLRNRMGDDDLLVATLAYRTPTTADIASGTLSRIRKLWSKE